MEEEIKNALAVLHKEGTILYPTDTVWGLGCDARNKDAVAKLFKIKQRAEYKSMVVLVCDEKMLNRYVKEVPAVAWDLIEAAEEPITIIYPDAMNVARNVIADDGTVAIRIVRDEFCRKLISLFKRPVVSTSANLSGQPAPIIYSKIPGEITEAVDHIVNFNRQVIIRTKPSTIIRLLKNGEFEVIRK